MINDQPGTSTTSFNQEDLFVELSITQNSKSKTSTTPEVDLFADAAFKHVLPHLPLATAPDIQDNVILFANQHVIPSFPVKSDFFNETSGTKASKLETKNIDSLEKIANTSKDPISLLGF